MKRDERLNKAIEGIRDLIERANIDMTIEEFVYRYATNRGIKKDPENVYRNLEKYQLYSDGNYKHLYNILEDSLNFMKPNPKEFNQLEYIKQYNKDNYKHYHIKVNLKDKDVIDKLNEVGNKNGYIVDLIKKDLKRK